MGSYYFVLLPFFSVILKSIIHKGIKRLQKHLVCKNSHHRYSLLMNRKKECLASAEHSFFLFGYLKILPWSSFLDNRKATPWRVAYRCNISATVLKLFYYITVFVNERASLPSLINIILVKAHYSAALKLYSGFSLLTVSAVSWMYSLISWKGLYANGASSRVFLFTEVV